MRVSNIDADAYADTNGNRHGHSDTNSDSNGDRDSNANSDANGHGYRNSNPNADSDGNATCADQEESVQKWRVETPPTG